MIEHRGAMVCHREIRTKDAGKLLSDPAVHFRRGSRRRGTDDDGDKNEQQDRKVIFQHLSSESSGHASLRTRYLPLPRAPGTYPERFCLVPTKGLEPPQPFGHQPLKLACLPISPRRQKSVTWAPRSPGFPFHPTSPAQRREPKARQEPPQEEPSHPASR